MLEGFRDILIVVLFLESVIVITLLIVLVLQVSRLVSLIKGEVTPILTSVRRTTSTMQGTAEFVSETTVMPLIRVATALAATNRFVRSFLGLSRR
ncbi:MAG: hypothetical protein ACYC3S_11385 [Chloroflexota bacterium]